MKKNATTDFLPHLDEIKVAFYVSKKIKGGVVIVGLLDSRQLDVQAFYFRLTMSRNVEAITTLMNFQAITKLEANGLAHQLINNFTYYY